MYDYYDHYSSSASGAAAFTALVMLIILVVVLIAAFMAISMLIKASKRSGYPEEETWRLWFIGICATPIILGLCVIAFQFSQRAGAPGASGSVSPQTDAAQLPPL